MSGEANSLKDWVNRRKGGRVQTLRLNLEVWQAPKSLKVIIT